MSVFGPIVASPQIEAAVRSTLQTWFPTYLSEIERQQDIEVGSLARPRTYVLAPEQDLWPGEQLPGLLIVSTGTTGTPEVQAGESLWAWWEVAIAAVVQASTEIAARAIAGNYAAVARTILLQRQSLDGLAQRISWRSEALEAAPGAQRNRTQAAAISTFHVLVPSVTDSWAGPAYPQEDPEAPFADNPDVATVILDIERVGIASPLPVATTLGLRYDVSGS